MAGEKVARYRADLRVVDIERINVGTKVAVRHGEARDRGMPQPESSGREDGLSCGTTDVHGGGPGHVDNEGNGRLFERLQVQGTDDANLGLGIGDSGISSDGPLELDREAREERKGCHGGSGRLEVLLKGHESRVEYVGSDAVCSRELIQ